MTIQAGPYETVHLFAAELEEQAFWDLLQPDPGTGIWALPAMVGVAQLDPLHVDGVDAGDFEGLGLSELLIEGQGVDPEALAGDRARIDALTGLVLILQPGALPDGTATLDPHPPLRHLGSWPLLRSATVIEPLTAASAEGDLGPPPPTAIPARAPRLPRALGWVLAVLVLIVLLVGVFL